MPFIPVPNTAQVTILQTLFGQEVVNVLHFFRSGGYDLDTLIELASTVRDRWALSILPHQSADLSFDGVRARNLDIADGFQFEVLSGEADNGGVASPALPGNVAFCITHRTANIGRSRRGRTYLAGIVEGQVTGNTIAAPVADDFVTGFNALRTFLAGQGDQMVIASRYTGGAARPVGVVSLVVNSVARDLFVDSQRGRLSS